MGVTRPVIEMGSGSAPAGSSPATDIMEEIARQMVQKFFTSMRSCIDLILSRGSSFEFARILLENQLENIGHTGSPSQARACLIVTPRSRRYGDVMATYIREVKTPSRVR